MKTKPITKKERQQLIDDWGKAFGAARENCERLCAEKQAKGWAVAKTTPQVGCYCYQLHFNGSFEANVLTECYKIEGGIAFFRLLDKRQGVEYPIKAAFTIGALHFWQEEMLLETQRDFLVPMEIRYEWVTVEERPTPDIQQRNEWQAVQENYAQNLQEVRERNQALLVQKVYEWEATFEGKSCTTDFSLRMALLGLFKEKDPKLARVEKGVKDFFFKNCFYGAVEIEGVRVSHNNPTSLEPLIEPPPPQEPKWWTFSMASAISLIESVAGISLPPFPNYRDRRSIEGFIEFPWHGENPIRSWETDSGLANLYVQNRFRVYAEKLVIQQCHEIKYEVTGGCGDFSTSTSIESDGFWNK